MAAGAATAKLANIGKLCGLMLQQMELLMNHPNTCCSARSFAARCSFALASASLHLLAVGVDHCAQYASHDHLSSPPPPPPPPLRAAIPARELNGAPTNRRTDAQQVSIRPSASCSLQLRANSPAKGPIFYLLASSLRLFKAESASSVAPFFPPLLKPKSFF